MQCVIIIIYEYIKTKLNSFLNKTILFLWLKKFKDFKTFTNSFNMAKKTRNF